MAARIMRNGKLWVGPKKKWVAEVGFPRAWPPPGEEGGEAVVAEEYKGEGEGETVASTGSDVTS